MKVGDRVVITKGLQRKVQGEVKTFDPVDGSVGVLADNYPRVQRFHKTELRVVGDSP